MSDSVRPQRQQPTRLPHPWDSPGKNTGLGCHCLLQCMKVKSVWLWATPWTAAYQAPPSMGFSRQEYWSGVPCPSPEESSRWSEKTIPIFLYFLHSILVQNIFQKMYVQTKNQIKQNWKQIYKCPYLVFNRWGASCEPSIFHSLELPYKRPFQDFPGGKVDRNQPDIAGETGLIPGPGRPHMPQSS